MDTAAIRHEGKALLLVGLAAFLFPQWRSTVGEFRGFFFSDHHLAERLREDLPPTYELSPLLAQSANLLHQAAVPTFRLSPAFVEAENNAAVFYFTLAARPARAVKTSPHALFLAHETLPPKCAAIAVAQEALLAHCD